MVGKLARVEHGGSSVWLITLGGHKVGPKIQ